MLEFLETINRITGQARASINAGNYKEAQRLIKKLKRMPYGEAHTYHAELTGRLHLSEGKFPEAKEAALQGFTESWGNSALLQIIRAAHEFVTKDTSRYIITVEAGGPAHSFVASFNRNYEVSFTVFSDNEFEAMKYLVEVARYKKGYSPLVIRIERASIAPTQPMRKGVYGMTPFSPKQSVSEPRPKIVH